MNDAPTPPPTDGLGSTPPYEPPRVEEIAPDDSVGAAPVLYSGLA